MYNFSSGSKLEFTVTLVTMMRRRDMADNTDLSATGLGFDPSRNQNIGSGKKFLHIFQIVYTISSSKMNEI